MALALASAVLVQISHGAAADGVVVVRGNKMYNQKSGERFFIKGVRLYTCIVSVLLRAKGSCMEQKENKQMATEFWLLVLYLYCR